RSGAPAGGGRGGGAAPGPPADSPRSDVPKRARPDSGRRSGVDRRRPAAAAPGRGNRSRAVRRRLPPAPEFWPACPLPVPLRDTSRRYTHHVASDVPGCFVPGVTSPVTHLDLVGIGFQSL